MERRTLALKASEERFRALADNNPLRIRRYDREGAICMPTASVTCRISSRSS